MDSTVYLRPDRCYYRSRAIRVDGPEVDRVLTGRVLSTIVVIAQGSFVWRFIETVTSFTDFIHRICF
jgi:hypothetical protein